MAKPNGLRLFMRIAPQLSFTEPRPINQQYWSDVLGITQPTLGKLLDEMVSEDIFKEHPPDGRTRLFTVNPGYPGVQDHYNRILT